MFQCIMRKPFAILLTAMLLISSLMSSAALAAENGVVVEANSESATGMTATFTYENAEAKNVQIMGGFTFYRPNDAYMISGGQLNLDGGIVDPAHILTPDTWEPGVSRFGDAGYVADMTPDESTGKWSISVDLPSGSYLYQYVVTDADGNETTITDPANVPAVNALGASQVRSQFYVPFVSGKQAPADDWTFVMPVDNETARGKLIWTEYERMKYEGEESNAQQIMIYLPPAYDASREEPYKVLYLCHGGGGEEGDWFNQGNADNIVDRLIASGDIEPFIIAAIDISKGTDTELVQNVLEYTIPYIEANYNVSKEVNGRAFAGLSKGGKLTYAVYQYASDKFGYFGVFSVGHPSSDYSILDAVALNQPVLYLSVGFADMTYDFPFQKGQIPMAPYSVYLTKCGVKYIGLKVMEGSHDWFTWQQTLRDFVRSTLWK